MSLIGLNNKNTYWKETFFKLRPVNLKLKKKNI